MVVTMIVRMNDGDVGCTVENCNDDVDNDHGSDHIDVCHGDYGVGVDDDYDTDTDDNHDSDDDENDGGEYLLL